MSGMLRLQETSWESLKSSFKETFDSTHLKDASPQWLVIWCTLIQACQQIPSMSPFQQPPIFAARHAISKETYHPPSLLLPVIAAAIQQTVQHRYVLDVEFGALKKEAGSDGVHEIRGIEYSTEDVCVKEGYVRREADNPF